MTSTLDRPVKAPTFQGVGARRRAKDVIATILVSLAVVIALIPLVWVLFTVIAKGLPALTSPTWFTNSLSGLTASADGGGPPGGVSGSDRPMGWTSAMGLNDIR